MARRSKGPKGPKDSKTNLQGKRKPEKMVARSRTKKRVAEAVQKLLPLAGDELRAEVRKWRHPGSLLLAGIQERPKPPTSFEQTTVAELKTLSLTRGECICAEAVLMAEVENIPDNGRLSLSYRIELTARFIARLIEHSRSAAEESGKLRPEVFAQLICDLAFERARELWAAE